ncbi:MAG: cysteine desulfurase family protein [Candidatus Kapaibacteriota bacterium]
MEAVEKRVYLDNNSTTKIDDRIVDAIIPFFREHFGNAASPHCMGKEAYDAVCQGREQIANLINTTSENIIFTSGATESINLALKGVAGEYKPKGNHIITVKTEHNAVLDTCKYLESQGYEISYIPIDYDGNLKLEFLEELIKPTTILIAVMYANNEIGVIHPIKKIAEIAKKHNIIFFCDGTQGVGKTNIDVQDLGIDMMAFSGHKIHAPKGIGALYLRDYKEKPFKIHSMMHGGGHELGLRSGTLNVPGIIGLGMACEIAKNEMHLHTPKIKALRDKLEAELLKLPDTLVNGSTTNRMPNITNILFKGVDSAELIKNLDRICASGGSACTSTHAKPSHVLRALGLCIDDSYSSVRLSISKYNTDDDIEYAISEFYRVVPILKIG